MEKEGKTNIFEEIGLNVQSQIDEMKADLDSMVGDMHKTFKKQNDEFRQDMEWELEGMMAEDPDRELKSDVRDMKKNLQSDIDGMQQHMKNTIDILSDKMEIKIEMIKDRSDVELTAAIGEIIQKAKETDVEVE